MVVFSLLDFPKNDIIYLDNLTKTMHQRKQGIFFLLTLLLLGFFPFSKSLAVTEFNPAFILSDAELQDCNSLSSIDIQKFLDSRGSYLRSYQTEDETGTIKTAAEIIYDAAKNYKINPKYILVTLQKEQSLITDDSPTIKQLNGATGYGINESCGWQCPTYLRNTGFGKQVAASAGLMRWYYDNNDKSYIKKKDTPVKIDNQEIIPGSWATAFLYTYTPHISANKNFWRIWGTWFSQVYPNGSLLKTASSTDVWLVQNGQKRRFKNTSALITRADPKMVVTVPESELSNYTEGAEISFPNYSILKTASNNYYLLDYDILRPFASEDTVRKLGYNPQEIVDITESDIANYKIGSTITASTIHPEGIIYQLTDLDNVYYLVKDSIVYPIIDPGVIKANFKNLEIVKKKKIDIKDLAIADLPLNFSDGTLVKVEDTNTTYVIENGKKRRIADTDTFRALGYNKANVVTIKLATAFNIPEGEALFLNASLLSAQDKFLGDSSAEIVDQAKSKLSSYLVAEYPSGRIISGKNIDEKHPIASLTKLITAYESINQNFDASKATTYSAKKYSSEGNPLGLVDGEKIKNNDLLNCMLVASANNTARMVAQASGLTEATLIKNANERLSEWGADNTTVTDVTGLEDGNVSTARDLLKIFTKVLANDSLKKILGKTEYTFKELVNKNKTVSHTLKSSSNKIVTIPNRKYTILASKTGYTYAAQSTFVMLIEAKTTKKQYIIVTLNNPDYAKRFDEPNRIANWISGSDVKIANK